MRTTSERWAGFGVSMSRSSGRFISSKPSSATLKYTKRIGAQPFDEFDLRLEAGPPCFRVLKFDGIQVFGAEARDQRPFGGFNVRARLGRKLE